MSDQLTKLNALIQAAECARAAAAKDLLFASNAGFRLTNAAFDLFECNELYDLSEDVAHELRLERDAA